MSGLSKVELEPHMMGVHATCLNEALLSVTDLPRPALPCVRHDCMHHAQMASFMFVAQGPSAAAGPPAGEGVWFSSTVPGWEELEELARAKQVVNWYVSMRWGWAV